MHMRYIIYGVYPSRGGYCRPIRCTTYVMAGATKARRESPVVKHSLDWITGYTARPLNFIDLILILSTL